MVKRILNRVCTDFLLIVMFILMLAIAGVGGYFGGMLYTLNNVKAIPVDERIALIDIDESAFPFLN